MNEDKAQSIASKYPKLFRKMPYLECDEGWLSLLDGLFSTLEWHINGLPIELQEAVYLEQVKEKFGSLRVYLSQTTPFINGAIFLAEKMSGAICEYCGSSGKIRSGGWIKTLCDDCDLERKNLKK